MRAWWNTPQAICSSLQKACLSRLLESWAKARRLEIKPLRTWSRAVAKRKRSNPWLPTPSLLRLLRKTRATHRKASLCMSKRPFTSRSIQCNTSTSTLMLIFLHNPSRHILSKTLIKDIMEWGKEDYLALLRNRWASLVTIKGIQISSRQFPTDLAQLCKLNLLADSQAFRVIKIQDTLVE